MLRYMGCHHHLPLVRDVQGGTIMDKGDLVCGRNNCKKFGSYYHEKDDCCEKPGYQGWGDWSSWSSCDRGYK